MKGSDTTAERFLFKKLLMSPPFVLLNFTFAAYTFRISNK
jgi:hypothetical protein